MRGDQRREAGLAHQRLQRVEDVARGFRIEVAGRLVGQKQQRRIGDGARNRDALLLAARELGGAVRRRDGRCAYSRAAALRVRAASLRDRPAIICGIMMFSSAENSGSRWWN